MRSVPAGSERTAWGSLSRDAVTACFVPAWHALGVRVRGRGRGRGGGRVKVRDRSRVRVLGARLADVGELEHLARTASVVGARAQAWRRGGCPGSDR